MSKDPMETVRKSISLPAVIWDEIAEWRFSHRITSEAEAVRRLVQAALDVEKRKAAKALENAAKGSGDD